MAGPVNGLHRVTSRLFWHASAKSALAGADRKGRANQLCPTTSADYIPRPCRQLTSPDDELAAVKAAIRRAIEDDKFPHAPRLDPLRAALARFEAAAEAAAEPTASPAKADKRARR
jgi:hypothetical protein